MYMHILFLPMHYSFDRGRKLQLKQISLVLLALSFQNTCSCTGNRGNLTCSCGFYPSLDSAKAPSATRCLSAWPRCFCGLWRPTYVFEVSCYLILKHNSKACWILNGCKILNTQMKLVLYLGEGKWGSNALFELGQLLCLVQHRTGASFQVKNAKVMFNGMHFPF